MSERLHITLGMLLLYGLTLALGITAAFQHVVHPAIGTVTPLAPTVSNGVVFAGVFLVLTASLVLFKRFSALFLRIGLALAFVLGAQFVFVGWMSWWASVVVALAMVSATWLVPVVLVHDIAIVFGIAGISALMGLSITPLMACVILAALSLYDVISVYRTRHMVALAGRMLASGAVFGFLVPARPAGWLMRTRDALDTRQVMMLGSGDIGLPLVLAASAMSTSMHAALLVGACSLIGVMLMHWLFAHQTKPMPMAALPPIAASAIIGYGIAILLNL